MQSPVIRDARDDDAAGLIVLVGSCFAEYPGCVLDVDGELPELRAIGTSFARSHGRFWVAEQNGSIVGAVGWTPSADCAGVELKKLYVARSVRRSGLGSRLAELVEAAAREGNAPFVELWSDTRFEAAHAFYERRGYRRDGATRDLHDKSNTVEYHYRLDLR